MTQKELCDILKKHKEWLDGEEGGARADLRKANLSRVNLSGADLIGTNLSGASLTGANLSRADLTGTDLSRADLTGTDLSVAYISGANLSLANLSGANLYGANLTGVNLTGAKLPHFQIVPEIGPFYAYKKLKNCIATLYIPRSAKRTSSLVGRKCRASKVKVIALSNNLTEDVDRYSELLKYKIGRWVSPDKYDDDIREECTNGIHFFMTKKEAEEY